MKVAFTIQHPTHVHFFKNVIRRLEQLGHETVVYSRSKDVNIKLMEEQGIDYKLFAGDTKGVVQKFLTQMRYEGRMILQAKKDDPDIFVSEAGVAAGHVSSIVGAKSVVFINNEHATFENTLAKSFSDDIYVPSCYNGDSTKLKTYDSYYVLSHTHPKYFSPSNKVLKKYGLGDDKPTIIIRKVAWDAIHDIGVNDTLPARELISILQERGYRVLISSEKGLPSELQDLELNIKASEFHDILYYSDLYIGEGGATAAESALLGTPSIYTNSISLGYLDDIEQRYDLLRQPNPITTDTIMELVDNWVLENSNEYWKNQRERILQEKEDVVEIMIKAILSHEN